MTKSVFYSFHYDRDAWRVQQIMQMGAVQGQRLLGAQEWEDVKREGEAGIKRWIANQMEGKSAVVVLIGSQTVNRSWVQYEITRAWENGIPMVGVRIHGLRDASGKTDSIGGNPFQQVALLGGGTVADYVQVHTPSGYTSQQVYDDIKNNLARWVDNA